MDKKTLIGLGLIGVILAIFTYFNQPTKEQLKERKEQQEQTSEKKETAKEDAVSPSTDTIQKTDSKDTLAIASAGDKLDTVQKQDSLTIKGITLAKNTAEQTYILENNKLKVVLTNKGGGIKSVYLKEYQTYDDYAENRGNDSIVPLQLFDEGVASNGLFFKDNGENINTKKLAFSIEEQKDSSITFITHFGPDKSIEQTYSLSPNNYHVNYQIRMNGFEGDVEPNKIYLDWHLTYFSTEKYLPQERRNSTIFYQQEGEGYDYLSEHSDDEYNAEKNIDWIAFKQSYFSSIMMPYKDFSKKGTYFKVKTFSEEDKEDSIYIKEYGARLNLAIQNTSHGSANIKWFFGPNDYELLASHYHNGTEDIINYSWGFLRWVNVYLILPVFDWLASTGMNLGLAILILTILIKIVLTPIQWKMYASSAKMRILKPEIEEINKKYPNKEDRMKKQTETMSLYKESGASPMAGCIPMLIQMPLLFAVFRFFPSTFSLRQASFLWAEDLSSYDSILNFSFDIPFYGSHVSLFTLLMAITTLFYTRLNSNNMAQPSQPGMPNMKVIMYFFPIMMIFFFNSYASGLSLYYFISTLMSVLTMIIIKQYFVDEDKLKEKMASRKEATLKKGKKGKSKFQQRLEDMQKQQQEKAKNQKKLKK